MGRPPPYIRAMPERKRFFLIDVFPNANGDEGRRLYCFSLEQICRELRRNITGKQQRVFYWAKIYFFLAQNIAAGSKNWKVAAKDCNLYKMHIDINKIIANFQFASICNAIPSAQKLLISNVFCLYQSLPKQHRYRKRERLYSDHLAHIHTRRYSPSLFVCEIPEAGKRKITQQQMSYVG